MQEIATVLAVLATVAACGGAAKTASTSPHGSDATTRDVAALQRQNERCEQAMGPFLRKLQALDSRLDVGLTQADYNTALGDARVVYDRIPTGTLAPDCLQVGVYLEDAFNAYAKADNRWANCINNTSYTGCDVDLDAKSHLQARWQDATTDIGKAERALAALKP